eukprot:1392791-Amphidinium_carterae.2
MSVPVEMAHARTEMDDLHAAQPPDRRHHGQRVDLGGLSNSGHGPGIPRGRNAIPVALAQRHKLIPGWKLLLGRLRAVLSLIPILCYASMALQSSPMSLAETAPFLLDEEPQQVNDVLVAYSDIIQDVEPWRHLMNWASDLLGSRTLWEPSPDSDFARRVADLAPGWRISKLAINRSPKVHRFFSSVPHTHRAGALLGADGTLELFSEDLSNVTQPKTRFKKPIALGLFLAGMAPEQYAPHELQAEGSLMRGPGILPMQTPGAELAGDYKSFKCAGQVEIKVPRESALDVDTARSVAKMHNAMGHPDMATLCRLLAQHHARPEAIFAAKHLHCQVCLRHARQVPPRSTTLPRMQASALGEIISMDIIFLNVPTMSRTVGVLGMVCHGTLLHQACRIASREPAVLLKALYQVWLSPFGFPHEIITDQDGGFRGEFSNHLTDRGIVHRLIPADCHEQLGRVEKANFTLKGILQKLCDELAIASDVDFDRCLVAALHAKNSPTQRAGRTAFQAAFGRHPRLPGSLHDDRHQPLDLQNLPGTLRAESMRLSAIQAMVDFEQQQALRNSQLRQPQHLRTHVYSPGDRVCFWREKGPIRAGGRTRKPGWQTAVFVMHDPGSRKHGEGELRGHMANCWVHSGGRLILVGLRQLRPAAGEEQYVPSQDDWDLLEQLRQHPGQSLAEHHDEVATPIVGADQEDAEEADLMLPDPRIIDGLRTPRVGHDLLLPHRVPLTPVPLPAMASTGMMVDPPAKSARASTDDDAEPPSKVARKLSNATNEVLVVEGDNLRLIPPLAWDGSGTHDPHRTAWQPRDHNVDDFSSEESEPDEEIACETFVSTAMPSSTRWRCVSSAEESSAERAAPVAYHATVQRVRGSLRCSSKEGRGFLVALVSGRSST